MAIDESAKHERSLTDQSLTGERAAADRILEQRNEKVEAKVDKDVAQSRVAVDEVRHRARVETDAELTNAVLERDRAQLDSERRVHDAALEHERAVSDSKLAAERSARKRAIAELLSAEREQTNDDLHAERDRADEELDTRDDALASISHELRNLIGIVTMSADRLLHDATSQRDSSKEAQRISRAGERMMRIVTDLLDVASIGYDRLTIVERPNDTTFLLKELRETFEPVASKRGIALDVVAEAGSKAAWYDGDRIHQVLANLLGNAFKFTPDGGHVELGASASETELHFFVRDNGPGIGLNEQGTIFERFRQSSEHRSAGYGLGLYICRAVVQAHRGRIWVESAPGRGSTFHVAIPLRG